jgi:hypothetical protein
MIVRRLYALAIALALAAFPADQASGCPEEYGPFEEDERPAKFPVSRCVTFEPHEFCTLDGYRYTVGTYARGGNEPGAARVRLMPEMLGEEPTEVAMTVLDAKGAVIAGPKLICDYCIGTPQVYHADLNGDGKTDYVAMVEIGCGKLVDGCDVGFALSSEQGYRIVAIREALELTTDDFIDLGDGRCRMVHTAFVFGSSEKGKDGKPHNYWVHNLLEFDGDRVVVSKADPRFPMWVWYTFKPNHEETTMITDEQKKRLWARVPGRIFRRPRETQDAEEADAQ